MCTADMVMDRRGGEMRDTVGDARIPRCQTETPPRSGSAGGLSRITRVTDL